MLVLVLKKICQLDHETVSFGRDVHIWVSLPWISSLCTQDQRLHLTQYKVH